MNPRLIRSIVVFFVAGVIALLVLTALWIGVSLLLDPLYYWLGPRLRIPPLPIPGPTGTPLPGVEGLVGILLYLVIALSLLAALVIAITELFFSWPFDGERPRPSGRQPDTA